MVRQEPDRPEDQRRGEAVEDRLALFSFLALAVLRIAYGWEAITSTPVLRQPLADSIAYLQLGRAIAEGSLPEPVFYRAPLYPFLIAPVLAIASNPGPILVLVQILLGIATIALVHRVARRFYGPRAALVALLLIGLYGPLASQETKLLATSTGVFLSVVAIDLWTSARGRGARLLAGLALGLGVLARPDLLLVLLGAAAIGIVSKDRAVVLRRETAPLLLGSLLAIAPATLHNAIHGRDLVLVSANGGLTFYHGNNPSARHGLFEPDDRVGPAGNAVAQARIDREAASREVGRPLRPSQASAHWLRAGFSSLLEDPARAVRLWGWKLIRLSGPHEYADNYSHAVERGDVRSLRLFVVPFPLLWIPALAGIALRPVRDRREAVLLLFAAVGIATCLLFYVASRYRCESAPALAILAGRALVLWRTVERRAQLRTGAVAALGLALAVIPPGRAAREQDGLAAAQWGAAFERDENPDAAARAYALAARLDPSRAVVWERWASLEEAQDRSRALEILDRGIAEGADGAEGALLWAARGALRWRAGDPQGAEEDLERAVREAPQSNSAALHLAACYVRRGADEDAGRLLDRRAFDRDPLASYYRGLIALRGGRWGEAAAAFDSSLAQGWTDRRAAVLRASAWAAFDRERARGWVDDLLREAPVAAERRPRLSALLLESLASRRPPVDTERAGEFDAKSGAILRLFSDALAPLTPSAP